MKTFLFRTSLLVVALCISTSIFTIDAQSKKISKKQQAWFDSRVWLQNATALPDESIDVATFADHYKKHPQVWAKVFDFLKNTDLENLPLGKQDLGDGLTVNVEEYTNRAPGKEWLEGHRKFIDVQYIVSGKELQGTTKIGNASQNVKPYTEQYDVANFLVPTINYHVIRPGQFTIFFPDDIHITNIQYGDKESVRKIVFKVPVE